MVVVLRTKLSHRRILPMMTNEQVLEKMDEDFLLRDTPETTRKTYLTALKRFSKFVGKEDSLADLNQDDLRAFLLYLRKDRNLQGTSINTYNAGCKFFLEVVLDKTINRKQVPNVRAYHKQPVYFRVEQLLQFFAHLNKTKDFVFFLILYATGMRTFELKNMKYTDIETDSCSGMRFVRIPHGKRNKERMVILPEACYQALRHYWAENRPETPGKWMFPAKTIPGSPKCTVSTNDFRTCLDRSRLSSEFHPHSLRSSFSCHFMQNNPHGILTLKHLLGHASLASTEIYLPLSHVDTTNTMSPSEICEILWNQYKARHVDSPTL
jgi:site-specific recombinase XerD